MVAGTTGTVSNERIYMDWVKLKLAEQPGRYKLFLMVLNDFSNLV